MAKERNTERRSAVCPLCGKTYTEYWRTWIAFQPKTAAICI